MDSGLLALSTSLFFISDFFDGDLAEYEEWIKRETLAVVLDWNGGDAPVIAKA